MSARERPTVNVCEHGDHPAPAGKRFCSPACQRCESESRNRETGCDGICTRPTLKPRQKKHAGGRPVTIGADPEAELRAARVEIAHLRELVRTLWNGSPAREAADMIAAVEAALK
jgi:hypothetical protein